MVEVLEHDGITAAATAAIRFWSFGQIMFQFTVHFGDIWEPRGVSGAPLAVLGRPCGNLWRPVSMCDGFWVTHGDSSGSRLGPRWLQISTRNSF